MATYSRSVVTTTRVEFSVPTHTPWGACWSKVYKAVGAAMEDLREAGRIPDNETAPDDLIRILCADDAVIVFYEAEGCTDG